MPSTWYKYHRNSKGQSVPIWQPNADDLRLWRRLVSNPDNIPGCDQPQGYGVFLAGDKNTPYFESIRIGQEDKYVFKIFPDDYCPIKAKAAQEEYEAAYVAHRAAMVRFNNHSDVSHIPIVPLAYTRTRGGCVKNEPPPIPEEETLPDIDELVAIDELPPELAAQDKGDDIFPEVKSRTRAVSIVTKV